MPQRPPKNKLPADSVRDFRSLLNLALDETDDEGRAWSSAKWGCYAFYDYDGEPIYVGQTNESLRVRVKRHLTNQRTDAVAMRILDVFEVAEIEMWPLWEFQQLDEQLRGKDLATRKLMKQVAQDRLNAVEHSAYLQAIDDSRFKAILNEKIPPRSPRIELPPSIRRPLINKQTREERGHPDVRIARRAETISRLAAVAHERGEVSDGLRRVLVIQAVRLTYLSAERLAYVQGREKPSPAAINVHELVGSSLTEPSDAAVGETEELDFEE
ncbi:GIY-YIG nuclease family protein [Kutzneria sp. NPDC052558]|uniref:GIY-YIG nuclease family protein n=1 Tax=Kutzneria sp. NPDC052558 TaxID=3364121 RepID=UPI0037CA1796